MYRISRHIIKAEAPVPHIPDLEGGHTTQLSDICYFVLNSPKRETFPNTIGDTLSVTFWDTFGDTKYIKNNINILLSLP